MGSVLQQPRRDTAGPGSTALHQPKPRGRGDGDGGAGLGLGTGICGEDGRSHCGEGNLSSPRKKGQELWELLLRGREGAHAVCCGGGPALVAGGRWEKYFQAAFKHPGLFLPLSILQIPREGVKPAGAAPTHCCRVTVGQPREPGDVVGGEVQAGTLHGFLEGTEKVPNHQKNYPRSIAV